MRSSHWRALLLGSVSHRAMVTRLAHGVDPRGVTWRRKVTTTSADGATTITMPAETSHAP